MPNSDKREDSNEQVPNPTSPHKHRHKHRKSKSLIHSHHGHEKEDLGCETGGSKTTALASPVGQKKPLPPVLRRQTSTSIPRGKILTSIGIIKISEYAQVEEAEYSSLVNQDLLKKTAELAIVDNKLESRIQATILEEEEQSKIVPRHRVHVDLPLHNNSSDLTQWLSGSEFKWLMSGSSWITEAESYYVLSPDGRFLFMQVGYSNLGWPSTTCQITGRCFKPSEGVNVFETQSISASKMKMTKDYTGVSTKQASLEHLLESQQETLALIRASLNLQKLKFDLTLKPQSVPFQINKGDIYFGEKRKDGYINCKYLPCVAVTGVFEDKETPTTVNKAESTSSLTGGHPEVFEGIALVIHQFQGVKPHLCASRWNLCFFAGKQKGESNFTRSISTLFMHQLQTPDNYDDATINYGAIVHQGKTLSVSVGNLIKHGPSSIDSVSGFPIPEWIEYTWRGRGFDVNDKNGSIKRTPITAKCKVPLKNQCARLCLLDSIPYVLRHIVATFIAKPFVYQWVDEALVDIWIGGLDEKEEPSIRLEGWIFQELALI